jgi:hypothetical protein
VGFDRPEYWGQYRAENVFLDGNSNLVLCATREGTSYDGGLVCGNCRGPIGTTWEARINSTALLAVAGRRGGYPMTILAEVVKST